MKMKTPSLTALIIALVAIYAGARWAVVEDSAGAWLLRWLRLLPWATGRLGPDSSDTTASSTGTTTPELNYAALRAYADANSAEKLRWGTFRSGLYYGIRSRTYPYYVSAGLLWGTDHEDITQLRHECRQEDRLQKYGWLQHDGRAYGRQGIEDQFNRVALQTSFVRLASSPTKESGQGWGARIDVEPLEPHDARLQRKRVEETELSLFFYVDLGCGDEDLRDSCREKLRNLLDVALEPTVHDCGDGFDCQTMVLLSEMSSEIPEAETAPLDFQVAVQLRTRQGVGIQHTELRYAGLKNANVVNIKERLVSLAQRPSPQEDPQVVLDNIIDEDSTLVVVQAVVRFAASAAAVTRGDIVVDVVLDESSGLPVNPQSLGSHSPRMDRPLEQGQNAFEAKFEESFGLSREFNASQLAFAQAAFSNLIGGTSFFYGSSLVQHDINDPTIIESARKPLFTAVPSRSFFPRGFLWDEGFHQLGIRAFDEELTRDVLVHWMGLMEDDGYVPREQILGQTARRRVPAEFLIQHVEHANPPALLLTLETMIKDVQPTQKERLVAFIRLLFPFVQRWYAWFLRTQAGPISNDKVTSFRWRGRRSDDGKLIANTLSSGLDDYPRASTPSDLEMHVDLLCWMIKANEVVVNLAAFAGIDANVAQLEEDRARYLASLDELHWDVVAQSYFDIGEHSEDGHIERQVVIRCQNEQGQTRDSTAPYAALQRRQVGCPSSHPRYMFPLGDGQGGLQMQPVFIPKTTRLQHVRHVGYVSLFPLLLRVLPPDSPKLKALVDQLADPAHLWSPFGLRSLSTRDLLYEQANAQGDNPYWRGSIWIPMNYLALGALHHYGQEALQSPHRDEIRALYRQLRDNVISTIYREYERTGYLWEQYNGDIHAGEQYGRGQRSHPFSGWTALVVNIMAEKY